jgi:hypothetical protein
LKENRFKESLLKNEDFIYTLELIPERGSLGKIQEEIIKIAEKSGFDIGEKAPRGRCPTLSTSLFKGVHCLTL